MRSATPGIVHSSSRWRSKGRMRSSISSESDADRLIQVLDVGEQVRDRGARGGRVKRPSSAARKAGSFARSLPFASSASARDRLALAERLEHRLARCAEHVGGDARELDVGVLEQLLQAVRLARALPHQRLAIAGQVAQLADRLGRHEARAQEPMLEQLAQPLRVLHVGLAPGHVLDVLGVDQQQLEVVLEQVVDGLPVDARGLHRHVRDAETLQPVAQRQQLTRSSSRTRRTAPRARPRRSGTCTQAVTCRLCTSSAQHRS